MPVVAAPPLAGFSRIISSLRVIRFRKLPAVLLHTRTHAHIHLYARTHLLIALDVHSADRWKKSVAREMRVQK